MRILGSVLLSFLAFPTAASADRAAALGKLEHRAFFGSPAALRTVSRAIDRTWPRSNERRTEHTSPRGENVQTSAGGKITRSSTVSARGNYVGLLAERRVEGKGSVSRQTHVVKDGLALETSDWASRDAGGRVRAVGSFRKEEPAIFGSRVETLGKVKMTAVDGQIRASEISAKKSFVLLDLLKIPLPVGKYRALLERSYGPR